MLLYNGIGHRSLHFYDFFQIENGADLCALNNAGKSAFYTSIKHAPNSFRSIEKRLDKGLILENPGSDSGPIIKMDFIAIVPR